MTITIHLELLGEAYGRVHYVEQPAGKHAPVLGTISIESEAVPSPPPQAVEVVLEFHRAQQTVPTPEAGRFIPGPTETFQIGDTVKIIKDRKSGTRYPPEWLEQYLGRTGRILWTTPDGAMVMFEAGATWFPYRELERISDER
jgi:hypothetical protein